MSAAATTTTTTTSAPSKNLQETKEDVRMLPAEAATAVASTVTTTSTPAIVVDADTKKPEIQRYEVGLAFDGKRNPVGYRTALMRARDFLKSINHPMTKALTLDLQQSDPLLSNGKEWFFTSYEDTQGPLPVFRDPQKMTAEVFRLRKRNATKATVFVVNINTEPDVVWGGAVVYRWAAYTKKASAPAQFLDRNLRKTMRAIAFAKFLKNPMYVMVPASWKRDRVRKHLRQLPFKAFSWSPHQGPVFLRTKTEGKTMYGMVSTDGLPNIKAKTFLTVSASNTSLAQQDVLGAYLVAYVATKGKMFGLSDLMSAVSVSPSPFTAGKKRRREDASLHRKKAKPTLVKPVHSGGASQAAASQGAASQETQVE